MTEDSGCLEGWTEAADWLDLSLEEKKKNILHANKTIESLRGSNYKRNVDQIEDKCGLKGREDGSLFHFALPGSSGGGVEMVEHWSQGRRKCFYFIALP